MYKYVYNCIYIYTEGLREVPRESRLARTADPNGTTNVSLVRDLELSVLWMNSEKKNKNGDRMVDLTSKT